MPASIGFIAIDSVDPGQDHPILVRLAGRRGGIHRRRRPVRAALGDTLWGSEIRFGVSCGEFGGDVVLVGEPAENLLPADPVFGEVDRFWLTSAGLSWGELAEGAVRPGGVVMPQVLGQHLAQVVLIDDQQPVEELPAQGAVHPFADRVHPWSLRRAGQDPDALRGEHGVERAGELARPVPDQELDRSCSLAQVHQEVAGCLRGPRAVRVRGDSGQVGTAGAVLDHDQRVDAPQQHGVHVDEIGGDNAAGLRDQELLPGRASAAGRGADPGVVQDLPDRGGGDRVAEPDEFALHPPVPPCGVFRRDADHELADRGCRGRPGRRRLA